MQVVWFACVLGAARGLPFLGTLAGLAFVGWHLSRAGDEVRSEAALIVAAGALGAAIDVALLRSGALHYASGEWIPGLGPHWMIALWMAFGATLNVAYRWLRGRWFAAALMGAVFGPLSYWAGMRLGGVVFPQSLEVGLASLSLAWLLAFPALVWLAERLTPEPAVAMAEARRA